MLPISDKLKASPPCHRVHIECYHHATTALTNTRGNVLTRSRKEVSGGYNNNAIIIINANIGDLLRPHRLPADLLERPLWLAPPGHPRQAGCQHHWGQHGEEGRQHWHKSCRITWFMHAEDWIISYKLLLVWSLTTLNGNFMFCCNVDLLDKVEPGDKQTREAFESFKNKFVQQNCHRDVEIRLANVNKQKVLYEDDSW